MEIIVNQDIRKFKTKDIGNFSFKECIFLVIAAGLGYGVYFVEKNIYHLETIETLPIVLVAAIPLAFGFFKPQGMTFWQFLNTVIKENFLEPKFYYWESDFMPDMEKYGEIYGEEYELSEERRIQIDTMNQIEHGQIKAPKISKEEKAQISL